jgi:putative nucleotidyltransferase with HDIG domain
MIFANLHLPILAQVQAALPAGAPIYLVGGAVRDLLLKRVSHDLDFAAPKDAIAIGRRVANALKGDFFVLDPERNTGRAILTTQANERYYLDFATFRGPDLESDLRNRDFTINAIAVDVHQPNVLIDPLGGASDLHNRQLRPCSATSFTDDPLRILRCVRQAVEFELKIVPEARRQLGQALDGLLKVSPERVRDELFRILEARRAVVALRILDMLGALVYVLPELQALKDVAQSPPHSEDVWTHTLNTVQKLADLMDVLQPVHDAEAAANWSLGLVSMRIGRYRQQLNAHLSETPNPDRTLRELLLLAALYHDVGKPATQHIDEGGRIRFFEHEQLGAQLAQQRGAWLHLSNIEIERLATIIRQHMRPLWLAQNGEPPTRRAIYRYFRDTGAVGVDICLLSLADTLATYGTELPQDTWAHQLEITRTLFEAWWEQAEEKVSPPALLNGRDLMEIFRLSPGPEIGRLLEEVREAQASGAIQERDEALAYVQACLGDDKWRAGS